MAGRGKSQAVAEEEPPPLGPENTLLQESDNSLMAAAKAVFDEDIQDEPADLDAVLPLPEPKTWTFGTPKPDDFVQLRGRGGGGAYLPARRRIMWMRGEIVDHPLWTIETREVKVIEGKYVSAMKVEGGYARIEALIFDEHGRLIASGRKTEYSERFMDFVEKAETGAIARALAVAGYGTESALDIDEGIEEGRIADAPVTGSTAGRPINITPSAIPGLKQGGRSEHVTDAQIAEIARINKELKLGPDIVFLIEGVTGKGIEFPPGADNDTQNKILLAVLRGLTFDQGAEVIQRMGTALAART